MIAVQAFADQAGPAARLSEALGVRLGIVGLHRFPDGESLPTVPSPQRTTIVYCSLDRPDEKLVPLLLAADAWRRGGAARLVLAAPYLCYLRQDTVFEPGQPVSRDVIGGLLGRAFDRIVTVQAHLHRTRDLSAVFGVPADNLSAVRALAPHFRDGPAPLVVGPDRESAPWAGEWALTLGGEALTLDKRRSGDREVDLSGDLGRARGRRVILVDDVASSGETLAQAARLLVAAGAASVDVAVAHALFDEGAAERLAAAGARSVISTDSISHPTNAAYLAPMLAEALHNESDA